MKNLCVFCGSGNRIRQTYVDQTVLLAKGLVSRGLNLVFGGGQNGLMGVLADTVIEEGGQIIGVIPESLYKLGVHHKGIQDLRVVQTLHERKALMLSISDGFVALPGGYGTLEEFSEVLSWAQLGLHQKPCAILNIDGYYDSLIEFFDKTIQEGFVRVPRKNLIIDETNPERLLTSLENYQPITINLQEEAAKMGQRPTKRAADGGDSAAS